MLHPSSGIHNTGERLLLADRGEELPHGDQERGEGDMGGSHAGFSGDCDAGSIGLRLPQRWGRATKRKVAYVQVELVSDAQLSGVGKPVLGELPQERREASAAPRQSRRAMDQESR